MSRPAVIVVCGPTASGKTALAEALASRFKARLVSADSRQAYRGMDIGTAKPLGASRALWSMLDVTDPGQSYSAGDYARQAAPLLEEAFAQGQPVIVAGGTGLYLRALLEGLSEIPAIPAALRQALEQECRELGLPALAQRLQGSDPELAQRTDLQNPRRVLRALEVLAATGKPLSWWQAQRPQAPVQASQLWLGLDPSPKTSERAIHARNQAAFEAGWVAEVVRLKEQWGEVALAATPAIGYQQILKHLRGELSLPAAMQETELRTRQYARRQKTWFKALPQLQWMRLEDPGSIQVKVSQFLEANASL